MSHTRSFAFDLQGGPNVPVRVYAPEPCGETWADLMMLVDSGARQTLLPLYLAQPLACDAIPVSTADPIPVIGGETEAWKLGLPLAGQLLHYVDGKKETYGPKFEIQPLFAEMRSGLLGRADFFQAFTVSFTLNGDGPELNLSY